MGARLRRVSGGADAQPGLDKDQDGEEGQDPFHAVILHDTRPVAKQDGAGRYGALAHYRPHDRATRPGGLQS